MKELEKEKFAILEEMKKELDTKISELIIKQEEVDIFDKS